MRVSVSLLTIANLALGALAMPADSSSSLLKQLSDQTQQSDACEIPSGNNCAGAPLKDLIVVFGDNSTLAQKALVWSAAKSSGATIIYDYGHFGFAGLIPDDVAELIEVHGKTFGLKMYDNACTGIPWCGEAPC